LTSNIVLCWSLDVNVIVAVVSFGASKKYSVTLDKRLIQMNGKKNRRASADV